MSRREPIWSAYRSARISSECPNCHARPNVWCTRPDGHVRRVPCIARVVTPSEADEELRHGVTQFRLPDTRPTDKTSEENFQS